MISNDNRWRRDRHAMTIASVAGDERPAAHTVAAGA
jgi:hypothetical protein